MCVSGWWSWEMVRTSALVVAMCAMCGCDAAEWLTGTGVREYRWLSVHRQSFAWVTLSSAMSRGDEEGALDASSLGVGVELSPHLCCVAVRVPARAITESARA